MDRVKYSLQPFGQVLWLRNGEAQACIADVGPGADQLLRQSGGFDKECADGRGINPENSLQDQRVRAAGAMAGWAKTNIKVSRLSPMASCASGSSDRRISSGSASWCARLARSLFF